MRTHPSLAGGRVDNQLPEHLTEESAFSSAEYADRLRLVRDGMVDQNIDVMLLMNPANVFYISGFQSISLHDDTCVIVPLDDEPSMVLHPPELGGAMLHGQFDRLFGYPPATSHTEYIATRLDEGGFAAARIATENQNAGMSAGIRLGLEEQLSQANFVDASRVMMGVKKTKSTAEIAHLRKAASVTEASMAAAIDAVTEGGTDNAIAGAATRAMANAGGEYPCLWPVVTSGNRSGILHSTHRRTQLSRGDSVLIEIGGCHERYNCPQMRTVSIGKPHEEVRRAADGCLSALNTVLSILRPGITAHEVAAAGWEAISDAGSEFVFHGNFGYSIGAGFPPTWADGTSLIEHGQQIHLESGMVFHHPIAVRRLGEFGVALSETSVITPDGCEILTRGERTLVVR